MCRQASGLRFWSRIDNAAAGFFDLLLGGCADFVERNGEGFFNLTVAEEFDLVARTVDQADLAEGFFIDDCTGIKTIIEVADIDDNEFIAEIVVVETTLRKTAVKRHLTAFETDTGAGSGAGLLTFVTFTGGFTLSGAFTGTETFDAMFGTWVWLEIMKFHFCK